MHDLLLHLAHVYGLLTDPSSPFPSPSPSSTSPPVPTPSTPDNTVRVAIVTAIGFVIAAGVTAIPTIFKRQAAAGATVPAVDQVTREYINSLLRDRSELRKLTKRHNHLREAVLERGLDPDVLIREQELP